MPYQSSMLYHLPPEVLMIIFEKCDLSSLGRLSKCCKKFNTIIKSEDSIWRLHSHDVFGSNMSAPAMQLRCNPILSFKDRCKLSKKWCMASTKNSQSLTYKQCMPWTVLERDHLLSSQGKSIFKYNRGKNGKVTFHHSAKAIPCNDDISKFAVNENEVVCAGRDGKLALLRKDNLHVTQRFTAHSSDILAIDTKKDVIISGCKNSLIKIWKIGEVTECKTEINIKNRVLSTAIMPSYVSFVVGTPGTKSVHPLQIFDLERGMLINNYGRSYRHGAGILDIFPETDYTFLTVGYDTTLRLWDIRCSDNCVGKWTEPYDNSLYCVQSDYNVTMLTGTSASGSFFMWDKRMERPIIIHFVKLPLLSNGKKYNQWFNKGPIFSVDFDASHKYISLQNIIFQFSYI